MRSAESTDDGGPFFGAPLPLRLQWGSLLSERLGIADRKCLFLFSPS